MNKKIFKYKFVYWITISLNILFLITFVSLFFSLFEESIRDGKEELVYLIAIFFSCILLFTSLILFILKNKNAIIVLTIQLTILFFMMSIPLFYSLFIEKDFSENTSDYFIVPIFYLIICGFLFMIYKFKYKTDFSDNEIDEIGKAE